jgi:hypothetical protein
MVVALVVALLAGPGAAPSPAADTVSPAAGPTPIMAPARVTADEIVAWYRARTPVAYRATTSLRNLARFFIEEGGDERVTGDVAFIQSVVETGWFGFSGRVPPEANNYAGIGATDDTQDYARFRSPRIGVRAQIQHLRAYADPTVTESNLAHPLESPRFHLVKPKGKAPNWEDMGGGNWATDPDYARKILGLRDDLLRHAAGGRAPLEVGGVPRDGAVRVSWLPPRSDGGRPITGYQVTASSGGAACTTSGRLACVVRGLTNDTAYRFRVQVRHADGLGQISAASPKVVPRARPGVPLSVVPSPRAGAARVSWEPPAGGTIPIRGYRVVAVPGRAGCTTTGKLSCLVPGLTNGQEYRFEVRAHNDSGRGPWSPLSRAVTPRAKPGAPTEVSGTPRVGAVRVTWQPPADDGGAPVREYRVIASPGGATCTTSKRLACSVTGLPAGEPHTFQVRARNKAGWGPRSAPSPAVTPA